MIKVDRGKVKIMGDAPTLMAEASVILKTVSEAVASRDEGLSQRGVMKQIYKVVKIKGEK